MHQTHLIVGATFAIIFHAVIANIMKLTVTYAFLALIAMTSNICVQDIVLRIYYGPYNIIISVIAGTGIGLVIKYWLDKRYIFYFKAASFKHDLHSLVLYAAAGVFTTCIFWGFEFGFQFLFETKTGRYCGAAIGLTIGYIIKYHLDKRFAFTKYKNIMT